MASSHQWLVAKKLAYGQIESNANIKKWGVESENPTFKPGDRFASVPDFHRHLDAMDQIGGLWTEGLIDRAADDDSWVPHQMKFWFKDSMEVLKDIVGNPKVVDHTKWHPERIIQKDGSRKYTEMWTGDWWWDVQVH
jgi:hypothetical protein